LMRWLIDEVVHKWLINEVVHKVVDL